MDQYKCSKIARQKCPDREICGEGTYTGGDCECAKFNEKCLPTKQRNIISELREENAKLRESAFDPLEMAKIAMTLQENATLKKKLEAYKSTGFTPEQISAGTTVTFDIGDEGFLKAINVAFKELFGITADDVPKIIAERDTLKKALELAKSNMAYIATTRDICKVCRYGCKENRVHCAKFEWCGIQQAQAQLTHGNALESERKP